MRRAAPAAGALAATGALLWLALGGLVNYDTLYSLVWGRELAQGRTPDLDAAFAPTPHPLGTLLGLIASPLSIAGSHGVHGQAATSATLIVAFAALAALGLVVYALGSAWFGQWAGVLATLIVLTRRPVLDFGARAYIDIPYLVLVLGALLVETRRPRAGPGVLALLGLAGLIRPEAWLFSAAYVGWLVASGERDHARLAVLVGAAATAPLLWALSDLLITGDPLHSLTGTRDTARELGRVTGIAHVPTTAPRRIGEILREPVLFGAAGGLVFAWLWLRERARVIVAAGLLALGAFTILAAAGLPILGRYLLAPAMLGAILCGAGALGWRTLPAGDRRRRPWAIFGALTLALLLAFTPSQVSRLRALRHALNRQTQIQDGLRAFVRTPAGVLGRGCLPVGVPNHRPLPLLALWLDVAPGKIVSLQDGSIASGAYVAPRTESVAHDYILDPRDLRRAIPRAPAGFRPVAANSSWIVSKRCAPGVRVDGGE